MVILMHIHLNTTSVRWLSPFLDFIYIDLFKGILYAVSNEILKERNVCVFPLSYKSYKLSANYTV